MIFLALALAIALVAALAMAYTLYCRIEKIGAEASALKSENARLQERADQLQQRLQQLEEHHTAKERGDEARFKAIASDVLSASARAITEQQSQRLDDVLRPLRDNIDGFRKSVTDYYTSEAKERYSLKSKIEELVRTNTSLGEEARELSRALRGNSKVQGDWGEMILESILEKSGLRRGEEYFIQATTDSEGRPLRDEAGRGLRPDVVVKYPGGRCVVVDSKVSLTAYVDLVNCDSTDLQSTYAKRHIASVRAHIAELAAKDYARYIDGGKNPDFIMMFIPNEGAYMAAMSAEPKLWQEAYDKGILILSPTNLVSALKIVSQLWIQDRQSRNAIEIATRAGRLYDKMADFVKDLETLRDNMDRTRKTWDSIMNKLSTGKGNILTRMENLRQLGAKAKKQIVADGLSEPDDQE